MKTFHVTWSIDLHAETPADAAQQALAIQHAAAAEGTATVFHVSHEGGPAEEIDLAACDRCNDYLPDTVLAHWPDGPEGNLLCPHCLDHLQRPAYIV